MNITLTGSEEVKRFVAYESDTIAAELCFRQKGAVMEVTRTMVNEPYRGKGLAKQLLAAAVDYARENGYKIRSYCSFVSAALDSDSSLDDIRYSGK